MTSKERVLAALSGREPDRVPWCEFSVDRALATMLLDWSAPPAQAADLESHPYSPEEEVALADHLGLDDLFFVLRAPVYVERIAGKDGRQFYGEGLIRERSDLPQLVLPGPTHEAFYGEARRMVSACGERAAVLVTRAGIFPTLMSMGMEGFSIALHEDREFLEEILDRYTEWSLVVAERVCAMGFDVYVTTDDMAFKTAPMFSPEVFRTIVIPRMRRLAEVVSLPWVVHSDGNIEPFLDDLVDLGVAGIHPVEKGAMDIAAVKRRYGERLCVLGNVDLNLLAEGTARQVDEEVKRLIEEVGRKGYIVSSGNSLTSYLRVENVRAMSAAVRKYGGGKG